MTAINATTEAKGKSREDVIVAIPPLHCHLMTIEKISPLSNFTSVRT